MKNRIRELRQAKKLSQAEFAKFLGIAQNTLSYWEQGKYEADSESLGKIADYFEVSLDYLMGREGKNSSKRWYDIMFGLRLKELREKKGLSQYAFANKFGIAQSTVGGWEAKKREPNFETIQRLADFFEVSIDYLIGREEKASYKRQRDIIFSTRLKELREKKGVLQKDVAAYLGVERTTYVKYELGNSEPNIEMLRKLADYFEVSVDYIIGREEKTLSKRQCDIIFSTRLKELRENRGLSQEVFGEKIGVAQSTVGNWESGSREPNFEIMHRLADFFEVSIDYLMGRVKKSPSKSGKPTEEDIKVALFDGDKEVTDEMWEEVKIFVDFIKYKEKNGKIVI